MSCEARNGGNGELLRAKSTFFPLLFNRTRSQRLVWVSIPQRDNLFCSVPVLNKHMCASSSCCPPTVNEDGTSVPMLVHQYHGNRVAFRVG